MKNMREKVLLLLISLLTISIGLAWVENTRIVDVVLTKNESSRNLALNKVLEIENKVERKAEGQKFLNNVKERYIKDQNRILNILSILTIAFVFSFTCFIFLLIELIKKNNAS